MEKKLYWTHDAPSVFHGVRSTPGGEVTMEQIARLGKSLHGAKCIVNTKPASLNDKDGNPKKGALSSPKEKGGDS